MTRYLFPLPEIKDGPRPGAGTEAEAVIRAAHERHSPPACYALFSGGHDSLCAAHVAMRTGLCGAVVHVNTGIGIERTREFVRSTCKEFGWPLLELHPPSPPYRDKQGRPWGLPSQSCYEAMVHRWGFPSPRGHRLMYQRLKERALVALVRSHRRRRGSPPVMLVSGIRKAESVQRMGYVQAEQVRNGQLWVAPLMDWIDADKHAHIEQHQLRRNPVAVQLCMSGECLCGAYARPGELVEVEAVCPATAAYIRSLEEQIKDAAHIPPGRRKWGNKPERRRKGRTVSTDQPWLPMCHGCEARNTV